MRFYIREKYFSFGDDFIITDERENVAFRVKGQVFSFGNKLRLYDANERELIYIEQEIFKFLPQYTIYAENNELATIKKNFTFFSHSFDIDSVYGSYTLDGDFTSHEFTIYRQDGSFAASLTKKLFSFGDSYEIEIEDEENIPFTLALVIVVDQVIHDNKNK